MKIKPQFLARLLSETLWEGISLGRKLNRRVCLNFEIGPVRLKGHMAGTVAITTEQKVQVTLKPTTQAGQPAQLDPKSPPKWSVPTGDCKLEVADDGMSAWIISSDTPGQSQVLVDADADLGDGVVDVSDFLTVNVAGAMAANLGLTVGVPVLKEPPAPAPAAAAKKS